MTVLPGIHGLAIPNPHLVIEKAFVVSTVQRLLDHQMWEGFEADVFFPCRGEYGVYEHDLNGAMDDRDERALSSDLPNARIRLQ